MKLHLGCGKRNFGKDWIHIDGGDFPHLHSHDITKLPFNNNTAEIIYASHVLEYFDRQEGANVLNEWYRILKENGKIYLAVPDFEIMMELYNNRTYPLEFFLGPIYGQMLMGDRIIYHKTGYDFRSLSFALDRVGFKNIKKYDWKETEFAKFDDHSQAYLPHMDKEFGVLISLNVEATK